MSELPHRHRALLLAGFIAHDLVYSLVRDTELPRKFRLRLASGVSGTYNGVTFCDAEGFVTRRGVVEEVLQGGGHQILTIF